MHLAHYILVKYITFIKYKALFCIMSVYQTVIQNLYKQHQTCVSMATPCFLDMN